MPGQITMKKNGLLAIALLLCLLTALCGRTDTAKESTSADIASDSVQANENGSETADPESLRDGRNKEAETGGSETVSGYPAFDFEKKP